MLTPTAPAVAVQASLARPDPEVPTVPERARRRQFTAAYKLRILQEADHTALGQLGALLRREGLYSSHLTNWRQQRAAGTLAALAPQRRGRPAISQTERELAQLRAENARLTRKLAAAETVIDVQKKLGRQTSLEPPLVGYGTPAGTAERAVGAPDSDQNGPSSEAASYLYQCTSWPSREVCRPRKKVAALLGLALPEPPAAPEPPGGTDGRRA